MMNIPDDLIHNLFEICEKVVISAIKSIYDYRANNSYIPSYYEYPERFLKGIEKAEQYDEFKEQVPAFKYGIPFYIMHGYNSPKNYGELLSSEDGRFRINCHTLDGFDEFLTMLQANPNAQSRFTDEANYLQSAIVSFVGNIANRYFYVANNSSGDNIDRNLVRELILKQFIRLFYEKLNVNICVPICFIEFDSDTIDITDSISIRKMSEDFQMSRFNACHFESTPESNIVQCANYMVHMSNYHINNEDIDAVQNSVKNSWSYPVDVIDDLFAAIRIASGIKTGYGQLLIEPDSWADKWTGDLLPLYGANIVAFNRNEVKVKFLCYHISKIENSVISLINTIFNEIRNKRELIKKKQDPFSRVFVAIQRLNRCMLREADDDTALDAIIGIEALLSGGTQGEITYTISNRMSVVASRIQECPYSASDARKAMKKIYGLRSDIVHGRDTDKNSTIVINGTERSTKEIAIDFLRFCLLFIIQNQKYLDVSEFENALDAAIDDLPVKRVK